MPRGPKPKPPRLRILNGNAGKRRTVESKPLAVSIPAAPKELSADARREWNRITSELAALGKVSQLSLASLVGYCSAFAMKLKAMRNLKKQGEILKGSRSGGAYQNPWLAVDRRASEQMAKFGSSLGLEALSANAEQIDELDDFLNDSAAS